MGRSTVKNRSGVLGRTPHTTKDIKMDLTLLGSQLFHPNTQKCQDFQCIMPKCAKLMLRHSKQLSSKCSKRGVEGDTCTEQCEKGFTPVAPFEVMCSDGKWLVDGEVPQCTPVDCKEPVISNAETCK